MDTLIQDVQVSSASSLDKEYTFTLPKAVLYQKITTHLENGYVDRVKIEGFRKGKVPLSILYKRHGQEILEDIIKTSVGDMVQEKHPRKHEIAGKVHYHVHGNPYGHALDALEDVVVHMKVPLYGEVPEISWNTIPMGKYSVNVTSEDVKRYLEHKASTMNTSEPLDVERPAEKGDTLVYTMKYLSSNGDAKEVNGSFQLGSGMLPQDFEESLIGVTRGKVIHESLRVPKNFPDKTLSGQKVKFEIAFSDVRKTVPYKVDESFAKACGYETLESMTEKETQHLQYTCDILLRELNQKHHLRSLQDFLDFPVSQMLLEDKTDTLWRNHPWNSATTEEEKQEILHNSGKSLEQLKQDVQKQALGMLRVELFIQYLLETKSFELTNEDWKNTVLSIALKQGISPEKAEKALLSNKENERHTFEYMRFYKVLGWIVQQCKEEALEVLSYEDLLKKL